MLTATCLGYRIGDHPIVSDVDIDVAPGELLAIVGPNGAGKSTLLALLAGDLTPHTGTVLLDGQPVHRMRPRDLARRRAVMPQQSHLQFAFTAAEVVALGAHAAPAHSAADHSAADRTAPAGHVAAALDRVGAIHLADRAYPTLSGGEQARVTFARVLAQHAPVVLLDEPTAHLDLRHQHLVMGVARTLAQDGHAVAAVLHDLDLAARYADRIAVLADGRLAASGPPATALTTETLSRAYAHPITVVAHPLRGGPLALSAA